MLCTWEGKVRHGERERERGGVRGVKMRERERVTIPAPKGS